MPTEHLDIQPGVEFQIQWLDLMPYSTNHLLMYRWRQYPQEGPTAAARADAGETILTERRVFHSHARDKTPRWVDSIPTHLNGQVYQADQALALPLSPEDILPAGADAICCRSHLRHC